MSSLNTTSNQKAITMPSTNTPPAPPAQGPPGEPHIVRCNFRSAGRLSNDSTRHLRTMHDGFARHVSHALDLFLGSPLEVKLAGVEQISSRDFLSSLAAGSYLVPFTLMPLQTRVIAKFDSALLFPLLDLLLGGSGDPRESTRELTDIDEELIRSVTELIGVQLERTWKACNVSVMPSPSLKPALVGQLFLTEERVVSLHFEITLGSTVAGMRIILPMAFCNALVRSSHPEAGRMVGDAASILPLRERLLDCNMLVAAELPGLAISVGDLLEMRPGGVIDLHVPLENPVQLGVSGYPLFEMTPVRRGGRKTAQLGRPCQPIPGA